MIIPPWHSMRQSDGNVYHDNSLCSRGQAVEQKYRKRGHRCRMRCSTCTKLASAEAAAAREAGSLAL
ncbi:MAG TPA: hypothetical protein VIM84_10425 [Gemmatimonadales bacterium]